MYLHKIPQPENPIFWEVFFDKTSPEIAEIPPFLVLEGQTLAGFFGLLSVVQGTGADRNQHGAWDAQPWDGDDQWVFGGYVNPGLINHCLLIRELGGYSSNSHDLILFYGTLPIKQPFGVY
jgi:hypothetical protein